MKFEPDHAVISEQWQTQMETEELQIKHSLFPALCPSACALSSLWWLPSVKCPIKRMPLYFALDHVNYKMSNFQLGQLLLPWSICCVENKRGEKAWGHLWTTDPKLRNLSMNGFAVLANKCAEEDANVSKHAVRKRSDRITVHVCKTPCFLIPMSEQKHCQCQRIGDGQRTHGDALSPCCGRNGKPTQKCELVMRATRRVELYTHHPGIPNSKMHRPPNNY